jgi:hypothetical protein
MAKKVNVDIKTIDSALGELGKLIVKLDKNPKKTKKEKNLTRKIEDIRNRLQDAVVYAKLKKSVGR